MKIATVIFTFSCDHACAVQASESAFDAGLGPVWVFEDGASPLPGETAALLRTAGCRVERTAFPRMSNLRGVEAFRGMLDCYDRVLKFTGASHVLKLDSDTMVVSAARINKAANDDVALAAMRSDRYPFFGMAMLLSRRLVDLIGDKVSGDGGIEGFDSRNFPEDIVTGTLATRFQCGEVRSWDYDPAGGFGAGYAYSEAKVGLDEYARRFDVVTFGNRHLIPGDEPSCTKRAKVAETMLEFRRILDRKRHGQP